MALNGTLEELAVLDLVQFVNQAHMSGALVLKTAAAEAELFYRKGGLVHARCGALTGLEVLVSIVDWTAGTFAFQPGKDSEEQTIRMDLHRAVMYALKTRDERKLEAQKREAAETRQAERKITLQEELAKVISELEFVHEAAIFDASGMLASAGQNGASGEKLAPLCKTLTAFAADYPRGRFRRGILDDENGTVLVSTLPRNRWLAVVASRGVALGAAAVGMGRLVARLEALGADRKNSSHPALVGVV